MGSWTLVRRFSDFGKLIHELKLEFSTPVNSFPSVINSVSNMYDHENNFIGGVSAIHGIKKRITILNEILKHLLNDEKVSESQLVNLALRFCKLIRHLPTPRAHPGLQLRETPHLPPPGGHVHLPQQ